MARMLWTPASMNTVFISESAAADLLRSIAELRAAAGAIPADLLPTAIPRREMRLPTDFDPNRWLEVFPRVQLQKGWVLDFVYEVSGNSGGPLLYARPTGEAPLRSMAAFHERFPFAQAHPPWLERVVFERSTEGAFEFAMMRREVPRFLQWWHAGYTDTTVVVGRAQLDKLLEPIAATAPHSFFAATVISESDRERLRALDLRPVVTLDGERAEIAWIAFTKWGGFTRITEQIEYPNRFLVTRGEVLVEYQCGIRF